jgi:hypothetical protein
MRERTAVLWSETGKTPAREAQLVTSAIRDRQASEFGYAGRGAARAVTSAGAGLLPRDRLPTWRSRHG